MPEPFDNPLLHAVHGAVTGVAGDVAEQVALVTMDGTQLVGVADFMAQNRVPAPMPRVDGALANHARVYFRGADYGVAADLIVIWNIGAFPPKSTCSAYYDPTSPWYNTFFGAYGVLSRKADRTWWGFHADGTPDWDEMFSIPKLDYNVLTAGALGCPEDQRSFAVLERTYGQAAGQCFADVVCQVPSGRHRAPNIGTNPFYYTIFGVPDWQVVGKAAGPGYEPVRMRGRFYFHPVRDAKDPITRAWGAMCPDTADGRDLTQTILARLAPYYGVPA